MNIKKTYVEYLYKLFHKYPNIYETDGRNSDIYSLVFKDVPDAGYITGLSSGLSNYDNIKHTRGSRVELCISVKTNNPEWGLVAGHIANRLKGKCPFNYGEIINFGDNIGSESKMTSFFTYAPTILEKEQFMDVNITSNHIIQIVGLYPIYKEEIFTFQTIGIKEFWNNENYDPFDISRPLILLN